MIHLQDVSFGYERNTPVLQDITLMENEPLIAGLWGRNGAGKTTLLKLLAGHLRPDTGSVEIMGMAPYNNEQAVRHVCYMQEDHLFGWLWTVRDALHFGRLFNPNWDRETARRLLAIFKLDEKKKVVKLSKGMRSALQYIIGLASFADITILDEPINGLDAAMRKELYETLLESYAERPRLILLSTHHIEELQTMFESLIVLKNGRLLLHEPMDSIRERGFWLTGGKRQVETAAAGQRVLEVSAAGSTIKVLIDAPDSGQWKVPAQGRGLAVEKAKTQDYLLSITHDQEVPVWERFMETHA